VKAATYYKWMIVVLAFFIVGYLREDVFVNINYMLGFKLQNKEAVWYFDTGFYYLLAKQSYKFLYILKWILTAGFSAIYYGLTVFFIKWLFNQNVVISVLVIYGLFFLFSGIVMSIGYWINDYSFVYRFSRVMMGVAQSPLVFIFLVPLLYWQEKNKG
jgi:hypothetical protein